MSEKFKPGGKPSLIGSLPIGDHEEAARLIFEHTPEIPIWAQLPLYPEEGMINQFMPGLPGLVVDEDRSYINSADDAISDELLAFYEEYMMVTEGGGDIETSRFAMKPDTAKGFFVFKEHLERLDKPPFAIKGQVTGPFTMATAVKDKNGRAIFYDEQIRDAAIKLIALKARWQVLNLSGFDIPVIIFIDEPALAGFGSSEFISISKQEVTACLEEVIEAIRKAGGLSGIHVCANTEWDIIMDTGVDMVNFDAYSYFDRFILYPDSIKKFLQRGGNIAWGIVPTSDTGDIEKETAESLANLWNKEAAEIEALGFDKDTIFARSMITPSCGMGSLSIDHTLKVLCLTRDLSKLLRDNI